MPPIPPLPDHPHSTPWSANVYQAYQIISDNCRNAMEVLLQEADTIRLKLHVEMLISNVVPILKGLELHFEHEGIPKDWLRHCTKIVGNQIVQLCQACMTAENQ